MDDVDLLTFKSCVKKILDEEIQKAQDEMAPDENNVHDLQN